MNKKNKLIIALVILVATITFLLIPTFTSATINTSDFEPTKISQSDIKPISDKVNPIIGVIQAFGALVSVSCIILLGIKYMLGSVSEKAEYKKSMIPYLVGAVLLFSITQVISFIANMVNDIG